MTADTEINDWLESLPEGSRNPSKKDLKQLAGDLLARRIQFLCGAGMSKASEAPLSADLVISMASGIVDGPRASKPYPDHLVKIANLYPLEAVAEAYLAEHDHPRLKRLLSDALAPATGKPHAGHAALEYFATQGLIDRVYTTNFDTLVEDGFSGKGKTIVDANADEIRSTNEEGFIPVLHLHGTIERGFLLTESSTYALDTPLGTIMRADMVVNTFVLVGYSLNDVDLRTMYLSLRDMLTTSKLARRPFVVHPLETDTEVEWRLARAVWHARGATFIPGKAEAFFPALQSQVRRWASEGMVRLIVEQKGGNPDDQREVDQVWSDALDLAESTGLGDEIEAIAEIAKGYKMSERANHAKS
jgi:SIR2-like protein